MELKQIKELMAAMERAGIKKLMIKEKTGYEIHLERQVDQEHPVTHSMTMYPPLFQAGAMREVESHKPHPLPATSKPTPEITSEAPGQYVTSPMVGTYYAAPSPDDPLFVKVGDRVDENTVVCIIEAMKVMNEVKAGVKGVVAEILLSNAQPVEFGTKILRIVES